MITFSVCFYFLFYFLSQFACICCFVLEQKYINFSILTRSLVPTGLPVQLSAENMVQPQLINLQHSQSSQCQHQDIVSHKMQRRHAQVCVEFTVQAKAEVLLSEPWMDCLPARLVEFYSHPHLLDLSLAGADIT